MSRLPRWIWALGGPLALGQIVLLSVFSGHAARDAQAVFVTILLAEFGVTCALAIVLTAEAYQKGWRGPWGLLAFFSMLGVVIVGCLPHRRKQSRGFEVIVPKQ